MKSCLFLFLLLVSSVSAYAHEIETNELVMADAPDWLKQERVQSVIDKVERTMEWDIRKIHVIWYTDQARFERVHGFGPSVLAIARRNDNTIHVGPRVNAANFDGVFGHELVHIIVYQKYKNAIPAWLDEGLANYVADRRQIDYRWLAAQPYRPIETLVHPFKAVSTEENLPDHVRYHYLASTALMEMLAAHCEIHDLLQLSVGKKLETYISTFCGISDLNGEFKSWLVSKHN